MITEQDHSPPFILSNRQQILHLIFGEWQPLLALLGKHFDGLSRIAWTKAMSPRCIEDCTQHFNRQVRCTWRFSPLEFRVSKPLNFKCRPQSLCGNRFVWLIATQLNRQRCETWLAQMVRLYRTLR